MNGNGGNGVITAMFGMPRFAPAWFSAFLLGLMLLFVQQLPQNIRDYTIPSLLLYSLGAAILGSLHRLLAVNYAPEDGSNNEKPIPGGWKVVLLIVHTFWFAALVGYNMYRHAI
jgi:hypothetical protein